MLEFIKNIIDKFSDDNSIPNPPYSYDFLFNLKEEDYPKYLKKIFKSQTGKELNLKNPKTFNEKIQWLKLYDVTPLKTRLTDKVLVRDWVKEKIGEKYLKPVLWIGRSFDEIPFAELPEQFIIKANQGCKWHYKIKNKEKFLAEKRLVEIVQNRFNGWIQQSFFPWAGFEMQYKDIIPQILIEPLLIDKDEVYPIEYEIYCFNGKPRLFQKIRYKIPAEFCLYNEKYQEINFSLNSEYIRKSEKADETLIDIVQLSRMLCADFKLVRVDWIKYRDKIYFNEITFTPMSGFFQFDDNKWNNKLGKMITL